MYSNRQWQARLQMKHDIIARKCTDNIINHTGSPTDCIRIRLTKNDEGDQTSRIIERADIVNIIFPVLKDVPYRRVYKDNVSRIRMTSLPVSTADEEHSEYQIEVPHNEVLLNDDLIIRVMQDSDLTQPIILCLQVLEPLGSFGGHMLIQSKYKCAIYNEELDENTLNVIAKMAERRLQIKF